VFFKMNSVKKVCNICSKSVENSHFARHQASHDVLIPCDQCSIMFNRKDSYKRHLRLHGENDVESDSPLEYEVDEEKVKDSIINFHVNPPNISPNSRTANFVHPFTCKIMGPRGSGKTSFTVSYIRQVACLTFPKIYIVTASPDQPLYIPLKENKQIIFITLDELEIILKSSKDILVVLDDVMKETRFNHALELLYTRGRHQRISIISLEQDLFYSNCVERRNVDYFILTRIRDSSCLNEFYKRYCRDIGQWRFIELYEMSVQSALGYIIIDFVNHKFSIASIP